MADFRLMDAAPLLDRIVWEHPRRAIRCEAVRIIARSVYGMDEITPTGIEDAAPRAARLHQPGERLRLLRDVARLDHVQVDDFCWPCLPDESGPDFFLYDLDWRVFARGGLDENSLAELHDHTGVRVKDLLTLRERFGDLRRRTLAYLGDGNNVAHSLLLAGTKMGMTVRVATPPGFEPIPQVVHRAEEIAVETGGVLVGRKVQIEIETERPRVAVRELGPRTRTVRTAEAIPAIDKTASRGIIHRRTAARYKSRLSARVSK